SCRHLLALQHFHDRRFGQWRHDRITLRVWVQSVLAQLLFQKTLVVYHSRIIVEVNQLILCSVGLHPLVERFDFFGRSLRRTNYWFAVALFVIADWKQRR